MLFRGQARALHKQTDELQRLGRTVASRAAWGGSLEHGDRIGNDVGLGLGGQIWFVVEPQIAVIDFERERGQCRAIDASALGAVLAVVGVPASGLVARGALKADDAVAEAVVPLRP